MSPDKDDLRPATTEELLQFLQCAPTHRPNGGGAGGLDRCTPEESGKTQRNCPPPSAYMEVVLGSCERAEGQALLDHASFCGACAQALAASLRALEGDPSEEELQALAGLATAQPNFQREISQALAESRTVSRPFLGSAGRQRRLWIGAAAAAMIAAVAAGFWGWQRHVGDPERLLARAYQNTRTLELRIPEAGFAALHAGMHTRSGAGDTRESPSLLEARAKLARSLESSPENDRSLELAGRADLLEEHYDAAIDKLDRLIAKGSPTAELLTDGASAYFERGLVTGREVDRTVALDYLRRADLLAPDDPVVLFNEAIVMEDRGQLMNAVDVWNRFATVERDPGWAAEGERRLAALETVVDRLKSHESRLMRMLATPEAMTALANDPHKLAQWDEELASVELDKLVEKAFPEPVGTGFVDSGPVGTEPASSREEIARGSPCTAICQAARTLLYATGRSLEQQHHDQWLADIFPSAFLIPSTFEALPPGIQAEYTRAMRLVAEAARENQTGSVVKGAEMAAEALRLFAELAQGKGVGTNNRGGGANNLLRKAGEAGRWRAAAEKLFALQRQLDFTGCRSFIASQLGGKEAGSGDLYRIPRSYPWIEGYFGITAEGCDDTPQTRKAGDLLGAESLRLATQAHYALLTARIQLHIGIGAELAGDQERREEQILGTLRELMRGDPPPIRVVNTVVSLFYIEDQTPIRYALASWEQEAIGWARLAGDGKEEIGAYMRLGLMQLRLGLSDEAQADFQAARELVNRPGMGDLAAYVNNTEIQTQIAEALLEQGDVGGAERALKTASSMKTGLWAKDSDEWLLNKRAAVTGQLQLEEHHYGEAERVLEEQIRRREGAKPSGGDQPASEEEQEITGHDHDLYGELAAVWLAEGKPPEDVLALWERFRLRSLGEPVEPCANGALACERAALMSERQRMGQHLLTGEIVLMDRVLVYEMDQREVRWSTRKEQRQDALNAVLRLEWAVSSPLTSPATVQSIGKSLADLLLPVWKQGPSGNGTLLLEPDPQLHGLAWSVLPTADGTLGLHCAMTEIPSILLRSNGNSDASKRAALDGKDGQVRPLVIGASVSGRDLAPLPEAIEEARQVGAYLRAPDLLMGSEATAQNVATELPEASVLHFAGHAVQDDGGTRLLLAQASEPEIGTRQVRKPNARDAIHADTQTNVRPDARPWIDEAFLRMHPPRACRLAVLSACATGNDERGRAVPMRDLVETLSSLGVPEVVATRWPVDSEASVPFMKTFYSSLESGQDVAHALLAARQSQARNSLYSNPYFWGAYYVTGQDQISVEEELHASTNSKSSQNRAQQRPL